MHRDSKTAPPPLNRFSVKVLRYSLSSYKKSVGDDLTILISKVQPCLIFWIPLGWMVANIEL